MTEPMVERVAKAIGKAQTRGWNGPWALARVAIAAALHGLPEHVKQSAMDETTAKSISRQTAYRAASCKAWRSRKRKAKALREAAKAETQGRAA